MRRSSNLVIAMFIVCLTAATTRGQETVGPTSVVRNTVAGQESTVEKLRDQIMQLSNRVSVLEEALDQAYPTNVAAGHYPGPYYPNPATGRHDLKKPQMLRLPPKYPSDPVATHASGVTHAPSRVNTKWEYLTIDSANTDVTERFNELGNQGWELATTISDSSQSDGTKHHHVFKRPIP